MYFDLYIERITGKGKISGENMSEEKSLVVGP
jgi:hypothetical protein